MPSEREKLYSPTKLFIGALQEQFQALHVRHISHLIYYKNIFVSFSSFPKSCLVYHPLNIYNWVIIFQNKYETL